MRVEDARRQKSAKNDKKARRRDLLARGRWTRDARPRLLCGREPRVTADRPEPAFGHYENASASDRINAGGRRILAPGPRDETVSSRHRRLSPRRGCP